MSDGPDSWDEEEEEEDGGASEEASPSQSYSQLGEEEEMADEEILSEFR